MTTWPTRPAPGAGLRSIDAMDLRRGSRPAAGRVACRRPAWWPAGTGPAGTGPGGIRVGRLFGVPVLLTVPWLGLSVLVVVGYGRLVLHRHPGTAQPVAYLAGLGLVACLLVSVLVHELGHAVVARRTGIGVRHIMLDLLGGHTELARDAPGPGTEALVALAGPVLSLLLGGLACGLARGLPAGTLARELAVQWALSNLLVAGYNALPGLPLDGGRALYAAVWALTRRRDLGDRVAGWTGRVVAGLTAALGLAGRYTGWLSWPGAAIAVVVALSLWSGATQALRWGRLTRYAGLVSAGRLARRLWVVPVGTPLSEALRLYERSGESGRGCLGVTDSAGELFGVVDPDRAAAVPQRRRPWVGVETVTAGVDVRRALPADLAGVPLIRTVGSYPDAVHLVTLGEGRVGVLRVAELVDVLRTGKQ